MADAPPAFKTHIRLVNHKIMLMSPKPERNVREEAGNLRIESQVDLMTVDRIVSGKRLMMRKKDCSAIASSIDSRYVAAVPAAVGLESCSPVSMARNCQYSFRKQK